jgi:hypothetical protein
MIRWRSLQLAAIIVASGCSSSSSSSPAPSGYFFAGNVYDGSTGALITNYTIALKYLDKVYNGTLDSEGQYFVGPLQAGNDFTIEISSAGYRSFHSHNAMWTPGTASFFYDAYLFPQNLQSPDVKFYVTEADSTTAPSGDIRLQPTSPSLLDSSNTDMPPSVTGSTNPQVWFNSDDLQQSAAEQAFSMGLAEFMPGGLVYGVTYEVTVFDVAGEQPFVGTYTSGVNGDQAITLTRTKSTPITVAYASSSSITPVPSGQLVIVFNQPVQFAPSETQADYAAAVDQALAITNAPSGDAGAPSTLNPPTQSRGTTIALTGNTMTIQWNQQTALAVLNPSVPITSVTYGNLNRVLVMPVNSTLATDVVSVATALGGATSLTVLTATP